MRPSAPCPCAPCGGRAAPSSPAPVASVGSGGLVDSGLCMEGQGAPARNAFAEQPTHIDTHTHTARSYLGAQRPPLDGRHSRCHGPPRSCPNQHPCLLSVLVGRGVGRGGSRILAFAKTPTETRCRRRRRPESAQSARARVWGRSRPMGMQGRVRTAQWAAPSTDGTVIWSIAAPDAMQMPGCPTPQQRPPHLNRP